MDGTQKIDTRGKSAASRANLIPYKPGESGGGGHLGGHQTARWRKAIAAAVTEEMCQEVILAMKKSACGVEVQETNRKTGETSIYSRPPDSAAARLFFEVLKVIGPDSGGLDLKDAPDEVIQWIMDNGN